MRNAGLLRDVDTTGADIYFGDTCLEGKALEASHADYVDDTVFPIFAKACEVIPRLVAATTIATDTFLEYGFSVNFSPGKTEAVAFFNGTGAIKGTTISGNGPQDRLSFPTRAPAVAHSARV